MELYYRADRLSRPIAAPKIKTLTKAYGWCDAPLHGQYNRPIVEPFAASHESFWRNDRAYDLVITTNHNQRPRIQGFGSAIFLHVANADAIETEGCIALSPKHLRNVLARCAKRAYLVIKPAMG